MYCREVFELKKNRVIRNESGLDNFEVQLKDSERPTCFTCCISSFWVSLNRRTSPTSSGPSRLPPDDETDSMGSSDLSEASPSFLVRSAVLPSSHTPGRVTPHSDVSSSLFCCHVKFILRSLESRKPQLNTLEPNKK